MQPGQGSGIGVGPPGAARAGSVDPAGARHGFHREAKAKRRGCDLGWANGWGEEGEEGAHHDVELAEQGELHQGAHHLAVGLCRQGAGRARRGRSAAVRSCCFRLPAGKPAVHAATPQWATMIHAPCAGKLAVLLTAGVAQLLD